MDEMLQQFLLEGRELVQQAADDLLALERTPGDTARVDSAFRAIHTLKGSVGLFDLPPMSAAMHAAEDLMGAIRDGRVDPPGAIDALLKCVGVSEHWLETLASTGSLPAGAAEQGGQLQTALQSFWSEAPGRVDEPAAVPAGWAQALLARDSAQLTERLTDPGRTADSLTAIRYTPARDCFFRGDDPLAVIRAVPALVALQITPREPWSLAAFDPFACNLLIEALSAAPAEAVRVALQLVADQVVIEAVAPDGAGPGSADRSPRTLRVDAARLDAIVAIAGALTVAKNGLAQVIAAAAAAAPDLAKALNASQAELDRLTGELHRAVMGARMVPLDQCLRRFPRLVRDLSAKLDRQVQFDVTGGEIEADKATVDGLFEPLLHVLRNAVDHGIEAAPARSEAGKPAAGSITLAVTRHAGQIVITVVDDGAGIDPARIREAAQARGVMDATGLDTLDDEAVLDLIFAPGFSTAPEVTAVSGRGVGMDAVRTAVRAMGGRVAIASQPGAGSSVRISLPETMALITIIMIQVSGELFGVPVGAVIETARLSAEGIMPVHGGSAFVHRGGTIPLLQLAALLGLPEAARGGRYAKVLIAGTPGGPVGLEVEAFGGRTEVLLLPLSGVLAGRPGLAGATLAPDGRVLVVLDLPALLP